MVRHKSNRVQAIIRPDDDGRGLQSVKEGSNQNKVLNVEGVESIQGKYSTVVDVHEHYRSSQRKYFDAASLVPILLISVIAGITRSNMEYIGRSSPMFTSAFAFAILGVSLFSPYMALRAIVHYTSTPKRTQSSYKFSKALLQLLYAVKIEDILMIFVQISSGFYLLGRVYAGQCKIGSNVWYTQKCNPVADSHSIPSDQVIVLYLIPLVGQCLLGGISIQSLVICCILGVLFVILACVHVGGLNEAWTVMYSIFFMVLIYNIERLQRITFVHSQSILAAVKLNAQHEFELLELSAENERKLKEKEIYQLRSLMGNVAHDLKTPLHSIEADLDVLRVFMQKIPRCVLETAKAEFENIGLRNTFDPLAVFDSLTATCKFMGMAINRSQDFVKASHNIALVPAMETFDLLSTLTMSVNCVNHIQSTRTIIMHPLDPEICPCVISDKHWLSENIICLLSNALKYSDNAVVDLRIKLTGIPVGDRPAPPNTVIAGSDDDDLPRKHVWAQCRSSTSTYISSMPLGGAAVGVSSGKDIFERRMLLFTVEDTGIGITEGGRKNLFQPFQQAQRMAGGTGLGLYSLSKRIEALGGSNGVSDRSDGKQGSIFWFTFPYRPDEAAGLIDMLEATTGNAGTRSPASELLHRRSILVVDDSLSILKVTSRLLKMNDHLVQTAANGFVGLKMLKEAFLSKEFDMVLTDLQMPVMDGIEATRRYREFEELSLREQYLDETKDRGKDEHMSMSRKKRRLLIIGMSANSDSLSKQEALDSGMDYFISKPFAYKDLKVILLDFQTKMDSNH